jgi:uncharacterized Ntn-hydrolase superfamily protein
MTLFKKSESTELKTRRELAEQTASAVKASETALLGALSNLEAARNRATGLERQAAELREKIAAQLRAGDIAGADKSGKAVADAIGAGEVAQINIGIHQQNIAACENDLVDAEQAADTAHRALHQALAAELLAELHDDARSKWLRCWQYNLAAGNAQPFQDFARWVFLESGAASTPTVEMDAPGAPPVAASIGHVERIEMRSRVFARQNAG